jgi:hypothetical protein
MLTLERREDPRPIHGEGLTVLPLMLIVERFYQELGFVDVTVQGKVRGGDRGEWR